MADALAFKSTMEFEYGVPREMAPGVVRLVANNPSPFTFKGTNTYLIGSKSLAVIDPGPSDAAHCAAIMAAAAGRPITHIVLTHTHGDHFEGLPALLAATGAKTAGYGAFQVRSRVASRPVTRGEGAGTERNWQPDIVLRDGHELAHGDWALTALHTPGHTPDHLSFALRPQQDGVRVLFPGDHGLEHQCRCAAAGPHGGLSRVTPEADDARRHSRVPRSWWAIRKSCTCREGLSHPSPDAGRSDPGGDQGRRNNGGGGGRANLQGSRSSPGAGRLHVGLGAYRAPDRARAGQRLGTTFS